MNRMALAVTTVGAMTQRVIPLAERGADQGGAVLFGDQIEMQPGYAVVPIRSRQGLIRPQSSRERFGWFT
jgi:hypothetical protein